jgi:putative transposase
MTRTARGTTGQPGKNVRPKAGLNRAILNAAWGQTETYLAYKARRSHKLVIEIPPFRSSQECRICGHTHPDNRISQSGFVCQACGHTENADRNASHVIAQRGVDVILSGNWKPKERKRTKITASKVRQVRSEGSEPGIVSIPYARGERVRRKDRKGPHAMLEEPRNPGYSA